MKNRFFTVLATLPMVLLLSPLGGIESPSSGPGDATKEVVGGVDAAIAEYPWMGALVFSSSEGNTRQFCGATAISPYWIMTAGHCVDDTITPENFKIVFGTADLENEATALVFYPKTILIHPDYINNYTKDNDIALVQLREPLPDSITKIHLSSDPQLELPGTTARLVGWGLTNTDFRVPRDTLKLQQVDMNIVSLEFANLPEYYDGRVHDNMITAGNFEPYYSSGSGDSGGPLLSYNYELDRWEQIGISNFGAGCDKPENPISAYARVSTHLKWINDILQNDFLSWAKEYDLPDLIYNEGDEHRPLMEYILGLDPTVIDHQQAQLASSNSSEDSTVRGKLRLRTSVPPINLRREWSRDLNEWSNVEVEHDGITKEIIPDSNLSEYHIPIASRNDEKGFYRIGHEDNRGIIHGPHTIRVGSTVKGLFNHGIEAYGLTRYDYIIDMLDSLRPIRITAESNIQQPFSIEVVELETGKQIFACSESGHPDSQTYPFSHTFWPEEGKQYLLRVSSLDWTLPQRFEIRVDHVGDLIDLNTFDPHIGYLTTEDHSYKRRNHFADTFLTELSADTNLKVEVRTDELDQILFIHDANTGELIHEVDQKPAGETESVLVRFDKNRLLTVSVASFNKNDTGEYVIQLSHFSEVSSIRPGEKTIGFINTTDRRTEINGNTYHLEEIDLVNLTIPEGVTTKLTGYDTYYPAYGVYNMTTQETVHTATARCDDKYFHFIPIPGDNYRLVIFAPTSRLGDNYELELIAGKASDEDFILSDTYSSKLQENTIPDETFHWQFIENLYKN
ncbi:MAG: serine protease [Verrucomicrobia bacterium]|nr:serine protease [Verrucomicrobiota bacterium]MDA1066978.1 serine protease [Verrucomicrobiota bacterium]